MRLSRLAVTSITLCASAVAQTPLKPRPVEPTAATSQLPITRVALYKNGVGFFEHAGRVTGDQSVTIDFTSAQLNDVLQSLTAIDLNGGRITGAGYNSTTPLDEQLKTLSLSLNATPTDVDFYNAIRGARVQLSQAGAVSFTGRLLSIDNRATNTPTTASSPSSPIPARSAPSSSPLPSRSPCSTPPSTPTSPSTSNCSPETAARASAT